MLRIPGRMDLANMLPEQAFGFNLAFQVDSAAGLLRFGLGVPCLGSRLAC